MLLLITCVEMEEIHGELSPSEEVGKSGLDLLLVHSCYITRNRLGQLVYNCLRVTQTVTSELDDSSHEMAVRTVPLQRVCLSVPCKLLRDLAPVIVAHCPVRLCEQP